MEKKRQVKINLKAFAQFFHSEKTGGLILMICVALSLLIANSSWAEGFKNWLDTPFGIQTKSFSLFYSTQLWINDGLMAVFFLLVGLEIKRELLEGELSNLKKATLPIFAALGGMLVPALIYKALNMHSESAAGWGIPMATDIAFALAIISLLGNKVPSSLKIFLAALAIVDDLGAIVVIALFYSEGIHGIYLMYAGGILALLAVFNYFNIKNLLFYLIPGVFLWYFVHHSGIHATIAGVLLAFTIPTNQTAVESPLEKLERWLHTPVSFVIMPLFALCNTNISFQKGMVDGLVSPLGLGIVLGLILGKMLGVSVFSWLAVKLRWSEKPKGASWKHVIGVGILAGIGFTMSIFIALLSFKTNIYLQEEAKFAILIASIIAGVLGFNVLNSLAKKRG